MIYYANKSSKFSSPPSSEDSSLFSSSAGFSLASSLFSSEDSSAFSSAVSVSVSSSLDSLSSEFAESISSGDATSAVFSSELPPSSPFSWSKDVSILLSASSTLD